MATSSSTRPGPRVRRATFMGRHPKTFTNTDMAHLDHDKKKPPEGGLIQR